MTLNKASLVGVFPYGKSRTRRSPGIKHVDVGSRTGAQPFEEIEDQVIEIFGHRAPANHYRRALPRAGAILVGPQEELGCCWVLVGGTEIWIGDIVHMTPGSFSLPKAGLSRATPKATTTTTEASGVFTKILIRSLEEKLPAPAFEEILRRTGETRSVEDFKEMAEGTSIEQFRRLLQEANLFMGVA